MASLVSLSSLREQSRQRADQVNSGFVTDAELNGYINSSLKALYDMMVDAYGSDYFAAEPPYDLTSTGDETYALPDDFYKLQGVDLKIDSESYTTLKPFMFAERNSYKDPYFSLRTRNAFYYYKIYGENIKFMPKPPANTEFRIWYVPICPTLALDSDTFDFVNGWEEYVIVDAAIKMTIKEEGNINELAIQKREMVDRLTRMKKDRDAGMPIRVTDVNRYGYGYDSDDDYVF